MARRSKPPQEKTEGRLRTEANDIAKRAQPFLERIERIEEEKESEKGAFMERCKAFGEDIKEIYGEAKQDGITVKALKGIVKRRKLEKKIDAIDDAMDLDEQAQFAALALAFAGTPFGEHAKKRAEEAAEDARDLRQPGASAADLVHAEEPRPDAEHLARIGRGPVPFDKGSGDASVVDELTR